MSPTDGNVKRDRFDKLVDAVNEIKSDVKVIKSQQEHFISDVACAEHRGKQKLDTETKITVVDKKVMRGYWYLAGLTSLGIISLIHQFMK